MMTITTTCTLCGSQIDHYEVIYEKRYIAEIAEDGSAVVNMEDQPSHIDLTGIFCPVCLEEIDTDILEES